MESIFYFVDEGSDERKRLFDFYERLLGARRSKALDDGTRSRLHNAPRGILAATYIRIVGPPKGLGGTRLGKGPSFL